MQLAYRHLTLTGDDEACKRQALSVTANLRHFRPIHDRWLAVSRTHTGILQAPQQADPGWWVSPLSRVARVLEPALTQNQMLDIHLFESDESAQAYAASLRPVRLG